MIEINKCKLVPGITSNWGDILGDITKQQDLVDYVASHGGGAPLWGNIQGDISDQEDLMYEFALDRKRLNDLEDGTVVPTGTATEQWVESQGYLVQSDLSQYATRQWVTGRGYATEDWVSNDYTNEVLSPACGKAEDNVKDWVVEEGYINQIKTVNNQSLVGTGNIEISGLTPEQEEALSPLVDTESGVLYTYEVPARSISSIDAPINVSYYGMFNLGGDIYSFDNNVYKYDGVNFNYTVSFSGGYYNAPYWMDDSGRVYNGIWFECDIENGGEKISMNGMTPYNSYQYDGYWRHNIWKGQYGIYLLNMQWDDTLQTYCVYKFNEDTQRFDILVECKMSQDPGWLMVYGYAPIREFEEHLISCYGGYMYELVEEDGCLYFELVEAFHPGITEYFPMTLPNGDSVQTQYFHNIDGEYYYLRQVGMGTGSYKLVQDDGAWIWETLSLTNLIGVGVYLDSPTLDTDRLILGGYDSWGKTCMVINPTDTPYKMTIWSPVSNVAVDLTSNQTIKGNKTFETIDCGTIRPSLIQQVNGPLTIYSSNINIGEGSIINLSGEAILNGDYIATKISGIYNKTVKPYGPLKEETEYVGVPLSYGFEYIWTTPSGRIFDSNNGVCYELMETPDWEDPDRWNGWWLNRSSMTVKPYQPYERIVKDASGDLYYFNYDDMYVYLWDDANTDWVQFTNILNESDSFFCVNGVLRCRCYGDGYIYKYDVSNSEWVREYQIQGDWYTCKILECGSHVYRVRQEYIDQVEFQNGMLTGFTEISNTYRWISNPYFAFTIGEDLFIPCDYDTCIADFSKANTGEFLTVLNYVPKNICYKGCWTDGVDTRLLCVDEPNGKFNFLFDTDYQKPEVPSVDGSYTLKATVLDGEVTYSWVPEV